MIQFVRCRANENSKFLNRLAAACQISMMLHDSDDGHCRNDGKRRQTTTAIRTIKRSSLFFTSPPGGRRLTKWPCACQQISAVCVRAYPLTHIVARHSVAWTCPLDTRPNQTQTHVRYARSRHTDVAPEYCTPRRTTTSVPGTFALFARATGVSVTIGDPRTDVVFRVSSSACAPPKSLRVYSQTTTGI